MASSGLVGSRLVRTGDIVKYSPDGKKGLDAEVVDVQAPTEGLLHLRVDGAVVKNVPVGDKSLAGTWY